MPNKQNRRALIKTLLTSSVAMGAASMLPAFAAVSESKINTNVKLKGNINHSVCQWCYGFIPVEELCQAVKEIGFGAIDRLGPKDWPMLQKYGLYSSMCYIDGPVSLTNGFNDKKYHAQLIKSYEEVIPMMAKAGYKNVICFSGSRNGMDDETGLKNCAEGLQKILPLAEKNGITIQMELLNSKIDHKDYTDDLDLSGVIGIRGKISDWFVDFSQNFGQNTFDFNITNSANYSAIADTTGKFSSFQTQFDAGGMKFSQYTTNLDVSKKHDILEGLNTAFGAEYRIDGYDVRAGEEASYSNYNLKSGVAAGSQVYAGFLPQNAISKTRSSFAIYSDNELDITKKWLLAGALRFENYSDFGSTLNWKLATRYSLNNWLSVRASASTGFRAPSQQQKYFAKTSTLFIGSSSTPTEVGTLTNDSKAAQILGIPQLKQETSFSIAGGITARPTNNLEITLDAYRVKVNDRIILTNNFSSSFFTDPTVKDQLLQSGAQVVNFFTNAINTIASGVEGVINYDTKLGEGKLRATLSGSFINNEVEKDANGTAIIKGSDILTKNNQLPYYFNREDQSRLEVALPKDKVSFMLNYNINKLNFMVRATRFGAVTYLDSYYNATTNLYGDPTDPKNWAKNAFNNNTVETLDQVFSPKIVTDLTVSYKFVKAFTLAVGANNIFDVYQDVNANSTNMSAGRFIYSRRVQQMGFNGRYVFARLAFNFK